VTGERTPIELARDPFFGRGGRLSPDGRLLAFNSNRSGRFDVFVTPLADAANAPRPHQVSDATAVGGILWRQDAKELFFFSAAPQSLMAVDITDGPTFQSGPPRRLFQLPAPVGAPAQVSAVGTRDGQRFVFAVDLPPRTVVRQTP
jgi:eukaryotic-like serine/threonine-protein kinase